MNNKAQIAAYAYLLMLAVVIIILGLALAKPVHDQNEESRVTMNCTGEIDDFTNAGCIVSDMGTAYFVLGIIAIGGVVIGARLLFE